MTPIFFEGRFGWLHLPPTGATTAAPPLGVVLCAAFAQEEMCTHYGLMILADRLAARGMPTLRFDYGGTGDSADGEVTLASLRADVVRAVACLRQESGAGAVALCGLRLGSAVAAAAAAEIEGVVGVAMLAPIVTGQAFLRETRAAASVSSLANLDPVPKLDSDRPLNTNGFLWSAALQRDIATIDLTAIPPPAPHMLLAPGRPDRKLPPFAASLRAQGTAVTEVPFVDYDAYMQDPTTHEVPAATFAAVETWLAALPHAETVAAAPVSVAPVLTLDGCEEIPLRFGSGNAVFGMLCRPTGHAAPVAALLLHEGSSHHIGDGRAYVALARRLAQAGIASLRMDLTGMGDSPAGANMRSPYFDPERLTEVFAGIDLLERHGYPKVVAFGLCSGADAAWNAGLADERVVGIFIINLQKFLWNYGDDLRVIARNSKRTLRSYARSMRNPAEWRRALSGKGDLLGIARVLAKRGLSQGFHAVKGLMPPAPGSEPAIVREQLRMLAARDVETLLIFSDEDPGLGEMGRHFGRNARRLKPPARVVTMTRADHHFNGRDVRRRYQAMIETAMADLVARHRADG
ncbi:alpha/beta hydrolase [Sphingomonas sp. R86521]|uniref:alpha/beta hydrolase n=1 Tax=Sphingomonas sp. R86521 TaxID=3093860 RepID=UPI0036D319E6